MRMNAWAGFLSSTLLAGAVLGACGDNEQPPTGGTGPSDTGGSGGQTSSGGGGAGGSGGTGGTAGSGGTTGSGGATTGGGGSGGRPECTIVDDCGPSDDCHGFTCDAGKCNEAFAPAGTKTKAQIIGDCKTNVCDGSGTIESENDGTDVASDADDCTDDLCDAGLPLNPASATGTACASDGGLFCDGMASCVECLDGGDCPSGICAAGGACAPATCNNGTQEGSETDVDCGGPVCGKCSEGDGCIVAGDCSDGVCDPAMKTCSAATCLDGVKNGMETAEDCGGPACGDCADGAACKDGTDCTSTFCYGSPLTCQPSLNGCTAATTVDMTGKANVTIDFGSFFYTPKCVKVSAGTQVTWSGAFPGHPLQGGIVVNNVPTPDNTKIPLTNTGTSKTIAFGAAGAFPYYCQFHVNSMQGVVFVAP